MSEQNVKYVWINRDGYNGTRQIAKEAGLEYLGYDRCWHILWKPGTTEGWVTKTGSRDSKSGRCYCNECVSSCEVHMLGELFANIGLTKVAFGESKNDTKKFEHYFRKEYLANPEELEAYRSFREVYLTKGDGEEEI